MSERLRKIVVNVDFQRDGETVYQVANSPLKQFVDIRANFFHWISQPFRLRIYLNHPVLTFI